MTAEQHPHFVLFQFELHRLPGLVEKFYDFDEASKYQNGLPLVAIPGAMLPLARELTLEDLAKAIAEKLPMVLYEREACVTTLSAPLYSLRWNTVRKPVSDKEIEEFIKRYSCIPQNKAPSAEASV